MINLQKLFSDNDLHQSYVLNRLKGDTSLLNQLTDKINQQKQQELKLNQLGALRRKAAASVDAEAKKLRLLIRELRQKQVQLTQEIEALALSLPNIVDSQVVHKEDNIIRSWGKVNSTTTAHLSQLTCEAIDFTKAALMSKRNFSTLEGKIAGLHRALGQFMLDTHVYRHGYQEVYTPYVVSSKALTGTGQMPKFADDLFKIAEEDLYLIPTGEVPLINLVRESILDLKQLPCKYTALTPCFRREAGAYGVKVSGLIRQHQFDKVELCQVTYPDNSDSTLAEIVGQAEYILQSLQLPYRVNLLGYDNLGFTAAKTYDLELTLSNDKILEVSSCSACDSFQARRIKTKINAAEGKVYPFTFNGSGLAVGRTLIGIIDQHQHQPGYLNIPDCLRRYMNGVDKLAL